MWICIVLLSPPGAWRGILLGDTLTHGCMIRVGKRAGEKMCMEWRRVFE